MTANPATDAESAPIATGVHPSGPPLVVTAEPEHCPRCGEPIQDSGV